MAMAEDDNNDEKRRVMTPPEEWGGNDPGASDLLGSDTDWLSEPEPEPESSPEPINSPEATTPLKNDTQQSAEETSDQALSDTSGMTDSLPETSETDALTASAPESSAPSITEVAPSEADAGPEAGQEERDELDWLTDGDTTNDGQPAPLGAAPPLDDELQELAASTAVEDKTAASSYSPNGEDGLSNLVEDDTDDWLNVTDTSEGAEPFTETPSQEVAADATQRDEEPPLEAAPTDSSPSSSRAPESAPTAGNNTSDWVSEDNAPDALSTTLATNTAAESSSETSTPIQTGDSEELLTDHQVAAQQPPRKFPLWPIVAIVTALVLLIVGGWGALSERAALQQRVAELEATLNQRNAKGDLTAEEESALQSDNQSLRLQLATLREQYSGMAAEISRLETTSLNEVDNLDADAATAPDINSVSAADASIAGTAEGSATEDNDQTGSDETISPDPEPLAVSSVGTSVNSSTDSASPQSVPNGTWFVNVASYSKQAIASEWQTKVQAEASQVITQEVEVNGRPLYRVRAIGYSSKSDAQAVAKQLERTFNIGPLWVGEMSGDELPSSGAGIGSSTSTKATPTSTPVDALAPEPEPEPEPITLRTTSGQGGWFIYVDTYANRVDADSKADEINAAGYEAKVAVEYRAGELFYRVQVVGIADRAEGERVTEELAQMGNMPNLQLRQY